MSRRKPLVSIIVPAYQAEKTIGRCLESIRQQTMKDFEVIVVNDGSSDGTAAAVLPYALTDKRFLLTDRKENRGVSETRNEGIARARGKYLQFVDSDDYLDLRATERLVGACEAAGCEMSISDFYRVLKNKILVKGDIEEGGLISRNEYAESMMDAPANFYYGVLWNKLYLTGIVKGLSVKFSEDLDWCEDLRFNLEYLLYVRNVCVVTHPTYYYTHQKGSLSSSQAVMKETGRVKRILFEYYKNLYKAADLYDENRLKIQRYYFDFARDKTKSVADNPETEAAVTDKTEELLPKMMKFVTETLLPPKTEEEKEEAERLHLEKEHEVRRKAELKKNEKERLAKEKQKIKKAEKDSQVKEKAAAARKKLKTDEGIPKHRNTTRRDSEH